jgi:hypothetical protein
LDLPEPYPASALAQLARWHFVRQFVPEPSWLRALQLAPAQA